MPAPTVLSLLLPLLVQMSPSAAPPACTVDDRAGVLSTAECSRLAECVGTAENACAARFAVVTLPTTGGRDLRCLALEMAQAWPLPPDRRDRAVLVLIATQDRRYAIQVTNGLGAVLTDGTCDDIARRNFVPNFRRGNFAGGIEAAIAEMSATLAGRSTSRAASRASVAGAQRASGVPPWLIIVGVILLPFVIIGVLVERAARKDKARRRGDADGTTDAHTGGDSGALPAPADTVSACSGGDCGGFDGGGCDGGW